jgi:hypothetical protein
MGADNPYNTECKYCHEQLAKKKLQKIDFLNCLLGASAKLRKAAVSFVMSICLSVCPQETTRLPLDEFS